MMQPGMIRRWLTRLSSLVLISGVAVSFNIIWTHRPLTVRAVAPRDDVVVRVFGLGTIEARIVSAIGFETSGALRTLHADHGDAVPAGSELARLDPREQAVRVERARAGVQAAEMSRAKAEATVGRAEAVLAQRRATNRRRQTLVSNETISREAAEEAALEADVAAADLAVARSEVEVARAMVADAVSALAYEETRLDQHVLRAPFDAVVVERHVEAGTVVQTGQVIFTLMAPETIWTLAYVDEARAGGIEVGQKAEIRLRSLPHRQFPGHVARIGIESDRVNEERRVWVACDQCPERVYLGEQAEAWITTATLDDALLVPERAIDAFDGASGIVWTVEDGVLARRRLTFGRMTEEALVEVTGGLPEGASIVAVPKAGFREGRSVRLEGEAPS